MPFTYRQVKDLYDVLADSGVVTKPLPDWSQEMNQLSGTDLYSAGLRDNLIKRASVGIDRLLEATGLPAQTEEFGRSVGEAVGNPEAGASIGRGLPRTALNFLPMLIPGVGVGATAARLGGMAALSGAGTYTETGSPAAGLLSGATAATMPTVANAAEQFALSKLGGRLVEGPIGDVAKNAVTGFSRYFPTTLGQGITSQVAGNLAAAGLGEASGFGQEALSGQPLHNPFSTETLLNLTLGQLPFAALYATKGGRAALGGEASRVAANRAEVAIKITQQQLELRAAEEANRNKQPLESIPPYDGPTDQKIVADNNNSIQSLRLRMKQLKADPTPMNMEEWNKLSQQENQLLEQQGERSNRVAGVAISPETPRQIVAGKEVYRNKAGTWRMVELANDEANGDLAGKLIGYSTLHEPAPGPSEVVGLTNYSLPDGWWTELTPNPKYPSAFAAPTAKPGTPELPLQVQPSERPFDHVAALQQAESLVKQAEGPSAFQDAINNLNAVREGFDLPPLNDGQIRRRQIQTRQTDPKKVALDLLKKTEQQIKVVQEVQQADNFRAEQELVSQQDEELRAELDQVAELERTVSQKGGKHVDKLLSGEINRMYRKWVSGGRKGSFDAFRNQVYEAARTGKGLSDVVVKVPSTAVEELTDADTKVPLKDIMTDYAIRALKEDKQAIALHQAWPGARENPIDLEQARFALLYDELGHTLFTKPITAADAPDIQAILRESGLEFLDDAELVGFKDRPHVESWRRTTERLQLEGASYAPARGAQRQQPFVPTTAEDTAIVQQVGQDGNSIADFLAKSEDPFVRALLTDIRPRVGNLLNRIRVQWLQQNTSSAAETSFNTHVLNLSDSSLRMPPDLRDREYLHELVHGLTLGAISDPANAGKVQELNAFRQKLVDALPAKMRSNYQEAVDSDFLGRWKRGQADINELGNTTEAQILYGLLNDKELVTQGFSSNEMRNFMRTIKMPGGNAFKRFVNWVKTMVGFGENVKDTAFEQFLGHVDGLLDQGEYVARLDEFGERMMAQEGLIGPLARNQAQRATAVVKVSTYGTSAGELFDLLSIPQAFKSVELAKAERDLRRSFQEGDEAAKSTDQILSELEQPLGEFGVGELLISALRGEIPNEALDALPGQAVRYLNARLEDMSQVLRVVDAATRSNGLVNVVDNQGLKGPVRLALKQIERVQAATALHDDAIQMIQALNRMGPDAYFDYVGDPREENASLRTFLGDVREEGEKGLSWFSRFLKPPSQMARENPETAEGISRGYELPANARKMASEGLKPMGLDLQATGTQKLTEEAVKKVSKVLGNRRVERAADQWIYWTQKKGAESGKTVLLPDSDPDVARALSHLTPQERSDVADVIAKRSVSQRIMNAQIVEKMEQIASVNGATLLGRFTGLKVAQNILLAESVRKAVATDFSDPIAATRAQQDLAVVQSKISPEAFQSLLQYMQVEDAKIKAWDAHFKENPDWASGQRYGKYLVRFMRGKKLFVLGADSKAHARKLVEGGNIESIELNRKEDEDAPPLLGPEGDKLILRMRELEQNQIEMLRANGVPPDELEALQRTSVVAQLEREISARHGIPNIIPPARGLTRGAEELPWLSNHFSWVQKASNYWSRQLFRAQSRAHLLEPEIATNSELQKWMRTHFDNILQLDPESVQKFKRFMTTWFMGYNPANVIVNASQPFITHVAELTAMTGKPIDSYQRVLAALREVAGHNLKGRDWATPEHVQLMKDAVAALEVGYGKFDDEQAAQESIATNYKRILAGNKPQTLGQRLGTLAGSYSNVGMWLFQHGEQVNSRAALLAGFDYYRERGLSYEDAKQKAFEFNRAVNFGGGRANRPVGAFSGRGPFPRGVAMLGTALQSYVLGTTFQLARYLKQGLFRPQGLTPGERHAALKAGVQLLATQFAAAGILGLPFVSGAIALLDKAFPELELNRKTREFFASFLSSDEENGSVLSDITMTGVPSTFGWDLQSRLSMGNTLPGVSEINGFQPEQLLGPGASLVSNFVQGGRKLLQGDSNGALNYVPPAVRKLAELIKEDGQVQDYRGRPIFEPTAGEKIGIALGFNPKRLSDFNAADRITEQNRRVETRRAAQFHQSLAEEVLKGNFGTVRAQLLSKAESDKLYNPVDGVRAVAKAAEELQFPRDLRREGTKATSSSRQQLLRMFRLDPSQPTETTRLQFRQAVQARLGLPATSSREQSIAALMDQGRSQNPTATRAELRRQAESLLRRSGEQTFLVPEETQ